MLGLLQPVLAVAVMASSSLLLIVNSLRLSRLPDPVPIPEQAPNGEPDGLLRGAGIPLTIGPALERIEA